MIRVLLRGRTGNNLFQYATGRWLSLKHGVPLILDASWHRTGDWKQAQILKRLNLAATIERKHYLFSQGVRKFTKRHPRELFHRKTYYERPTDMSFDPKVLELGPDCLLAGYFQTPLYFQGLRETLQREINLQELPADSETQEWIAELAKPDSVSVHFRRGDYLNYPDLQVCSDSYPLRAMEAAKSQIAHPRFFVFSDDLAWCRAHITDANVEFVAVNASKSDPLNDLRLMTHAHHHITVNSSYSWWGAWLHHRPGQKVFIPDRWFVGKFIGPISEKLEDHWFPISGK